MPVVTGGRIEGEEGGWTGQGRLRACVHVQAPGLFLDDTTTMRLSAASGMFSVLRR